VNGAAILFREPAHPYISVVMDDFVTNYDGNYWGQNGPLLMSRCVSRCNATNNCHLSVWSLDHAYLLSYLDFQTHGFTALSDLPKGVKEKWERVTENGEIAHFWNSVYAPVEDKFVASLSSIPAVSRMKVFSDTLAGSLWVHTCPIATSFLLNTVDSSQNI